MHLEAASDLTFTEMEALLTRLDLPTAGLRDQFPGAYIIAIDHGGVIGCAGLETYGRAGLLRSVAVSPARPRIGIGRALAMDRLAAARSQGLEAVYLLTTTAADFFARLGFVATDRAAVPPALASSREFTSICPAYAACLKVSL